MSHEAFKTPAEFALQDFAGTYLGVAPSDESALAYGEVEITIDEMGVTARYATGIGIEEFFTPSIQIEETDPAIMEPSIRDEAEKAEALKRGIDLDGTRTFKVGSLEFIFAHLTGPEVTLPTLMLQGTATDDMAPTTLLSPAQIEAGMHEEFIAFMVERAHGKPGDMPRLANDGYAHNYRPEPGL